MGFDSANLKLADFTFIATEHAVERHTERFYHLESWLLEDDCRSGTVEEQSGATLIIRYGRKRYVCKQSEDDWNVYYIITAYE